MRRSPNSKSVNLAEEASELEAQFSENFYAGSHRNPPIIQLSGKAPILISCPHAVNHPREGRMKLADTFTGALALQLQSSTNADTIIYARTSKEDPNYDADGPYKRTLLEYARKSNPKFLIDLHGLARSHPFQIVVGTAQGKTINQRTRDSFVEVLRRHGFSNIGVDIPNFFDASRPSTVTSFIWREAHIPSVQLEINKDFRDPVKMPDNYIRIVHAIEDCIHFCSDVLSDTLDPRGGYQ